MSNEADTCRIYVRPRLEAAGWNSEPHAYSEQNTFTDGRIIATGNRFRRQPKKRTDFLLRYTRDLPIAVVEAKAEYRRPAGGLQQAKDYAQLLGLMFAYATNGQGIVEFDYTTGLERELEAFPTPDELWQRLRAHEHISAHAAQRLLTPAYNISDKAPRYYQEIAVNRALQAILAGKRRSLLTLATGTGKTFVAFQICWRLWSARWNARGEHRRPKILYLADRNFLVDGPKDNMFAPFGDARIKIEHGEVNKGREIYFAIYQAIAKDERRPGLYKEFAPDFFDLIIVDECHRGSANDESNWHEILEYFKPAFQLGMTATPLRDDNKDTYQYFGNPIYTYSLKQGIEDGFLAPYRVHRIVSDVDATGWRPSPGQLDRYRREIPDQEYNTPDFERKVALRARTEAIARNFTDFLKKTDRFAKTIIFCVDQDHADEMRRALGNLNLDLMQQYPDYVARVTADEAAIGRGHLSNFQELESTTPVILTTSQLLTTGVDVQTCKHIVIARTVNSMTEFKQIIGRGTRVREDYGKVYFNIFDYTGSATRLFADPEFDGEPALINETEMNAEGETTAEHQTVNEPGEAYDTQPATGATSDDDGEWQPIPGTTPPTRDATPRKFYFDGGHVEIIAGVVYDLDANGNQLRVIRLSEHTAESVRTLYPSPATLREQWSDPVQRAQLIALLAARGIDFAELAAEAQQPDADPLDLLCHIAYSAPLRTRRERADRVRRERADFLAQYAPDARAVLNALLDKYAEFGVEQFALPDAIKVPPISERGNVGEIAGLFGGVEKLKAAVTSLQNYLYAG